MAAAALASATDPTQRDEADLLVRQGCPRTVLRVANWLAAAATVAVPAALAAVVATAVPGGSLDRLGTALFTAATLPAAGAWATAGSVLPDRLGRSRRAKAARGTARVVLGLLLVLAGAALPTITRSGSDLDSLLPLSAIVLLAGFALLSPAALATVARFVSRLPRPALRVGASAVTRNRQGLTMTVTLLGAVACLLVVQAVIGEGLGRREANRRSAIAALGPATAAGSGRLVLVQTTRLGSVMESDATTGFGGTAPGTGGPGTSGLGTSGSGGSDPVEDLPAEVRQTVPRTPVAGVTRVALTVRSGRSVYGVVREAQGLERDALAPVDVALATPQLLATLGLDPALARGKRAIVLDARVLTSDGAVALAANPFQVFSQPGTELPRPVRVPAVNSFAGRVAARLPAVLLPKRLVPAGALVEEGPGSMVVVRFPHRPTARRVRALADGTYADVARGDRPVDVLASHRTDRISTVWVRDRADSWRLLASILVLSAAAALVALLGLRLAVRREDEVLGLLGAAPRMQVAVSAARGMVIGVVGAVLGGAIGLVGTAIGLARYNATGRFVHDDSLAPVPFSWPPIVWLGLVALPVLTAAVGACLALGHRSRPDQPIPVAD